MAETEACGMMGSPGRRSRWASLSMAVLCLNLPLSHTFAVPGPSSTTSWIGSSRHHHASLARGGGAATAMSITHSAALPMRSGAGSSFLGGKLGCVAAADDDGAYGASRARRGGRGGGGGEQGQFDGSMLGIAMIASSGASRHNPRGVGGGGLSKGKAASSQGAKIFGKAGFGFLEDSMAPTTSKAGNDAAVTLKEAGLVPDVLPCAFVDTARLEVTYAKWVRSAVDLRNPFSFGDTPTRGAGKIQVMGLSPSVVSCVRGRENRACLHLFPSLRVLSPSFSLFLSHTLSFSRPVSLPFSPSFSTLSISISPPSQNGATITPTQAQDQPTISFLGEPGALYSIVMTDPDVPSRRNPSRWAKWTGSDLI